MGLREEVEKVICGACKNGNPSSESYGQCPSFCTMKNSIPSRILALIEAREKRLREFVEEVAREGFSTEVAVIKDCARRVLAELDKEDKDE